MFTFCSMASDAIFVLQNFTVCPQSGSSTHNCKTPNLDAISCFAIIHYSHFAVLCKLLPLTAVLTSHRKIPHRHNKYKSACHLATVHSSPAWSTSFSLLQWSDQDRNRVWRRQPAGAELVVYLRNFGSWQKSWMMAKIDKYNLTLLFYAFNLKAHLFKKSNLLFLSIHCIYPSFILINQTLNFSIHAWSFSRL